jgi:chaperonin GroES
MTVSIQPTEDRILVERVDSEEKTSGGILIPETAKEKPIRGKIVAVGNGVVNDNGETRPVRLKIGQVVIFGKWSGTEIKHSGKDFIVMKESDVLAVEQ